MFSVMEHQNVIRNLLLLLLLLYTLLSCSVSFLQFFCYLVHLCHVSSTSRWTWCSTRHILQSLQKKALQQMIKNVFIITKCIYIFSNDETMGHLVNPSLLLSWSVEHLWKVMMHITSLCAHNYLETVFHSFTELSVNTDVAAEEITVYQQQNSKLI